MDVIQEVRRAVVAIVNGDATLATITGHASPQITMWQDLRLDGALPILAYQVVVLGQTPADRDSRTGLLQFSAFATGNGAQATIEAMLERVEQILTALALDGNGVDGAPVRFIRREEPEDRDGSRGVRRADLDVELTLTKAA